jgi:hypothetical protein
VVHEDELERSDARLECLLAGAAPSASIERGVAAARAAEISAIAEAHSYRFFNKKMRGSRIPNDPRSITRNRKSHFTDCSVGLTMRAHE